MTPTPAARCPEPFRHRASRCASSSPYRRHARSSCRCAEGGVCGDRHRRDTGYRDDAGVGTVRKRTAAAILVLAAVVWLFVNGPVEGPILVVFSAQHGVTVADLASVLAVLVAGVLVASSRRR